MPEDLVGLSLFILESTEAVSLVSKDGQDPGPTDTNGTKPQRGLPRAHR